MGCQQCPGCGVWKCGGQGHPVLLASSSIRTGRPERCQSASRQSNTGVISFVSCLHPPTPAPTKEKGKALGASLKIKIINILLPPLCLSWCWALFSFFCYHQCVPFDNQNFKSSSVFIQTLSGKTSCPLPQRGRYFYVI